MTGHDQQHHRDSAKKQSIEAALQGLAEVEGGHRAPAALKQSIQTSVHHAMQAARLETAAQTDATAQARGDVPFDHLWTWLSARWWRIASMGSTAALLPLLLGALLGYQLTDPEDLLADPADDWISSYSTLEASAAASSEVTP